MNSVGSELICGVKEVVMSKFTQYFNFLQHVLRGFAKKLWGQLTPQLVHGSANFTLFIPYEAAIYGSNSKDYEFC
jgi:hypothetical protein